MSLKIISTDSHPHTFEVTGSTTMNLDGFPKFLNFSMELGPTASYSIVLPSRWIGRGGIISVASLYMNVGWFIGNWMLVSTGQTIAGSGQYVGLSYDYATNKLTVTNNFTGGANGFYCTMELMI